MNFHISLADVSVLPILRLPKCPLGFLRTAYLSSPLGIASTFSCLECPPCLSLPPTFPSKLFQSLHSQDSRCPAQGKTTPSSPSSPGSACGCLHSCVLLASLPVWGLLDGGEPIHFIPKTCPFNSECH